MAAFSPGRKVVFSCEACGSRLVKRTSWLNHPFLRNDIYVCDNPTCGASYSGHTELTGIASPSGIPNCPRQRIAPHHPASSGRRAAGRIPRHAADRQMELLDPVGDTTSTPVE